MKRNLLLLFFIILYSCGSGGSPTKSPSINYYTADQTFIDELVDLNIYLSADEITDGITATDFIDETTGSTFYKIKELDLSSMELDTIPPSINDLDSLIILNLQNNNLENLPISICDNRDEMESLYNQLDSLNIKNNSICTPTLPSCIGENTTIPDFYSNQQCNITPFEDDNLFLNDLVEDNWPDSTVAFINSMKNNFIEWEECIEEDKVVYRIIEIRYINKDIKNIPDSIGDLDSLRHLALENNQITTIPNTIGNLKRLIYFTIDHNNITYIPPLIKNLNNLEKFNISYNDLGTYTNHPGTIEENIGELTKLNELNLSNNELIILPVGMCSLLEISGITIYIDHNSLCPENKNGSNDACFNDLIHDSVQPASACQ